MTPARRRTSWALPTSLVGFSFEEWLRGSYWRLEAPTEERDAALLIRASADDLGEFAKTRAWRVDGTIHVDGLAHESEAEGLIALKLLDERRVLYRVRFRGDDGRPYELSGQKEWSGLSPIGSLTTLAGSLYDEYGREFARATLRFDFRSDSLRWIKSFRILWPLAGQGRETGMG